MPDEDIVDTLSSRYAFEGNLRKLIEYLPKTGLKSTDAQLALSTLYDEIWGLYDHNTDNHPLSQVFLFPSETIYGDNTQLEIRLKTYMDTQVKRHTGLSFIDFIDLPRHYQEIILRNCDKLRKKTDTKLSQLTQELENLEDND